MQALTLLYYVVERSDAACLLTAPPFLSDTSGVTARPLHLVLWTCSVSAQVLAIYSVERELSARMPRPPLTNARRDCCAALVAVQVMCWCSALLDARAPGATSYGLALAALSCAAFYALLAKAGGPLRRARGGGAARQGRAHRRAARARGGLLHGCLARLPPGLGRRRARRGGRRARAPRLRPLRRRRQVPAGVDIRVPSCGPVSF